MAAIVLHSLVFLCLILQLSVTDGRRPARHRRVSPPQLEHYIPDCQSALAGNDVFFNDCLDSGLGKIAKYVDKLPRQGPRSSGLTRKCALFQPLIACMGPYFEHCSDIRHAYRHHVRPVVETLKCLCSKTEDTCPVSPSGVACMEEEFGGFMAKLCDEVYYFHKDQDVVTASCRLEHNNVHCKEALVTSRCGSEAGGLAFHLSKLYWQTEDPSCSEPLLHHAGPSEYRYNDDCPTDFVTKMNECAAMYNKEQLTFMNNVLVPDGKKAVLQSFCRSYKEYVNCTEPHEARCPSGRDVMLHSYASVRFYRLRLDHICLGDRRKDFKRNLPCYQRVEKKKLLAPCSQELQEDFQASADVSAFEFYCKPEHSATKRLKGVLSKAATCYHVVYEDTCNVKAADAMVGLVEAALADPSTLGYDLVPHCEAFTNLTQTTHATPVKTKRHNDGQTPGRHSGNAPPPPNAHPEKSLPEVTSSMATSKSDEVMTLGSADGPTRNSTSGAHYPTPYAGSTSPLRASVTTTTKTMEAVVSTTLAPPVGEEGSQPADSSGRSRPLDPGDKARVGDTAPRSGAVVHSSAPPLHPSWTAATWLLTSLTITAAGVMFCRL